MKQTLNHGCYVLLNHKGISYSIKIPINVTTAGKGNLSLSGKEEQSGLLAEEQQNLKRVKNFEVSC